MNHRSKVYNSGVLTHTDTFNYLCEAVQDCNNNATTGSTCEVVEVVQSLTGEEEVATITRWKHREELA